MPRSTSAELLDTHGYRDLDELHENLRDMARYDRWLGVFDEMLQFARLAEARTALDVGVGSGTFIAHARNRAPHVAWTALDLSRDVLRISRECAHDATHVQAQAQQLPFADSSFDVVTCANTLHHLDERGAVTLLQECARVARQRVVILDLARGWLTHAGAVLLTHLTSRNRLTRADGVHSAQRAYTADEARALVQTAGLTGATIQQRTPFRFVIRVET